MPWQARAYGRTYAQVVAKSNECPNTPSLAHGRFPRTIDIDGFCDARAIDSFHQDSTHCLAPDGWTIGLAMTGHNTSRASLCHR